MLEKILECYPDEQFIVLEGLNDAIIGVEESSGKLLYSIPKCLRILESQDMTEEESAEFFWYNIYDAYMGEKTPLFCNDEF